MMRIEYDQTLGLRVTLDGKTIENPDSVTVYWDNHVPVATITVSGPELDITAWAPGAQQLLDLGRTHER